MAYVHDPQTGQKRPAEADDFPLPPPLQRCREPIDRELITDDPGDVKRDLSGQLYREWIAYENFTRSFLEAMNVWYREGIPRQIDAFPLYLANGEMIKFSNIQALKPTMYDEHRRSIAMFPQKARLLARNYQGELRGLMHKYSATGELLETYNTNGVDTPVFLGYIPVQLRSELCHLHGMTDDERVAAGEDRYDPGGYFIYAGGERTVVTQEHQRFDRIFVNSTGKKTGKTKSGRVRTQPPRARMTCLTPKGSTVVDLLTVKPGEIRLAVRLFNRGSDKTLPLISVMRLLMEDLHETTREPLPGDTNIDDAIMALIASMSKPEHKKKLWIHLQMSFWQAKREDFVDATWTDLALPSAKDASGKLPPQNRKRPRPQKRRDAQAAPPAETPTGPDFTLNEKRALLLEELKAQLFPQMMELTGPPEVRDRNRLNLLALMAAQYVEVLAGLRAPTDPDKWYNKRAETGPRNCELLFTGLWKKVIDHVQMDIDEMGAKIPTLAEVKAKLSERVRFIADEFRTSFVTSSWGVKDKRHTTVLKENISEMLKRRSQLATLAHLMKINVPVMRKGKVPKLRHMDASQYGLVCVVDTPEGANCGLNKYMAVTSAVSVQRNPAAVRMHLDPLINQTSAPGATSPVILNGIFLGWCNGPAVHAVLLGLRRSGEIHHDIALVYDAFDNILYVYSDGARLIQPLLIVDPEDQRLVIEKKNMWKAPWEALVRSGCIEYLDAWERVTRNVVAAQFLSDLLPPELYESSTMALPKTAETETETEAETEAGTEAETEAGTEAETETGTEAETETGTEPSATPVRYTHCYLDPTSLLGVTASIIPLANHNQAPRNIFQANMGKQATGVYHENHAERFDAEARVLETPSRPLFEPQINRLIGLTRAPPGATVTLAVLALPYNQEDAFIVKQSAIDRGLFNYTKYTPYKVIEKRDAGIQDIIRLPSEALRARDPPSRYRHIRPDGLPEIGAVLGPGDCIVGKVRIVTSGGGAQSEKNDSVFMSKYDRGIVDRVFEGRTEDGKRFVRVKIRDVRRLQVADKLASRHAQKGTIGKVTADVDMPFLEDGTSPDIICNSHAIPSRMTIGKVIEIITGNVAALNGRIYNATSFSLRSDGGFAKFYEHLKQELKNHGFTPNGKHAMRNGITGELMYTDVYVGKCFYQLLGHTVEDKIQATSVGGRQRDTRQPLGGRDNEGGSAGRAGEQERDAMLTSGATELMNERLMRVSDMYTQIFCKNCGLDVVTTHGLAQLECRGCGQRGNYVQCDSPYAFKHMSNILLGAGIKLRYHMMNKSEMRQPQKGTYDPQAAANAADAVYSLEDDMEEDEEEEDEEEDSLSDSGDESGSDMESLAEDDDDLDNGDDDMEYNDDDY